MASSSSRSTASCIDIERSSSSWGLHTLGVQPCSTCCSGGRRGAGRAAPRRPCRGQPLMVQPHTAPPLPLHSLPDSGLPRKLLLDSPSHSEKELHGKGEAHVGDVLVDLKRNFLGFSANKSPDYVKRFISLHLFLYLKWDFPKVNKFTKVWKIFKLLEIWILQFSWSDNVICLVC